jgi:hypothetical protein
MARTSASCWRRYTRAARVEAGQAGAQARRGPIVVEGELVELVRRQVAAEPVRVAGASLIDEHQVAVGAEAAEHRQPRAGERGGASSGTPFEDE